MRFFKIMSKTLVIILSASVVSPARDVAKAPLQLSVKKIMRDSKWIGNFPGRVNWSDDSKSIYFRWNPENADSDSLYVLSRKGGEPRKTTEQERKILPGRGGDYNLKRSKKVYEKNGDLFLLDIKTGRSNQITNTVEKESDPGFTLDENAITFIRDKNLYRWEIKSGSIVQLTDFRKGKDKSKKDERANEHEEWLKKQQLDLIVTLKENKEKKEKSKKDREASQPDRPKKIFTGKKSVSRVQPSPDQRFVTFLLTQKASDEKATIVPSYVTESGFTEDLDSRTKVGRPGSSYQFGIYDIENDSVYYVSTDSIPGITEQPEYLSIFVDSSDTSEAEEPKPRDVVFRGPNWSPDGKYAVLVAVSLDNKDRWILSLDPATGKLNLLDRQHDEAWVGGPGIWGWWSGGSMGWLADNQRLWYQSEATGYSHLYTVDVTTGEKKQLTDGNFELSDVELSKDKKYFYFASNMLRPSVRHFYRMPVFGGMPTQITSRDGWNDAYLSPDESKIALIYSYVNRPPELFLMDNKPKSKETQITFSTSHEFGSYDWRDPEIVTFTAQDSVEVYAHLFTPDIPAPTHPAVIFVHGAGYTQNVRKKWGYYYKEYMFHNLLADKGYTVLDIDYRGSAGYGRDCRTAIYRFMGGKDLSDQVDGAKFLVDNYGVDSSRIGIYGGSYGGFITLMAMFTEPGIFAAGAGLRSVADWAHYNHGYTSNILNVPTTDSIAYIRSSPIYHVERFEGALLMCHGMLDRNVHFQGVVRIAQRLIELGKENWELAVYPIEGHSFKHADSWTDEYRRIFELFEENLK